MSLAIRFGNKGNNILDATASVVVYEFLKDTNERNKIFHHTIPYYIILYKTALFYRIDLTVDVRKEIAKKIFDSLEEFSKNYSEDYKDVIQLVFAFKGIDETSGDFVGVSKIFTEQNFKFGDSFGKVVVWNGINPQKRKKPQWNNFNSIINEKNYQKFIETI